MTGAEIKKIREALGLEVFAFASILGDLRDLRAAVATRGGPA